jgi:hypothetical protein
VYSINSLRAILRLKEMETLVKIGVVSNALFVIAHGILPVLVNMHRSSSVSSCLCPYINTL